MSISYSISLTAPGLGVDGAINAKVLPLLHQAVRAIAQQTQANWQEAIYRSKLWSGEKDAYAQSVTLQEVDDFHVIVRSNYKHAQDIESGRPPRDLKKMLDTSQKVRRTEDGRRFLVIPMRSNTPGNGAHARAMPAPVYELVKAMAPSKVIGKGQRPSGEVTHLSPKTGMHASSKQTPYLSNPKTKDAVQVVARKYAWGGKLSMGQLKAAGLDRATAKRYAGMVRMDTSTPGGGKSSSYMSFRIMMDSQTGKWIIPAQPGLFLVKGVVEDMQPKAAAAFSAAVKKTMSGG